MRYSSEQLSNRRWGIYADDRLLASVGCYKTCLKILKLLSEKQKYHQDKTSELRDRIQIIKTAA